MTVPAERSTSSRPRPGAARIAGGIALRIVVLAAALVGALLVTEMLGDALAIPPRVVTPLSAVVALAVYVAGVRLLERRWPRELDARDGAWTFPLGFAIGGALFSLTVAIVWLLGSYHVDGTHSLGVLWMPLRLAVYAGIFEELLLRGTLFRILEEGLGTWIALAISAAVFGILHILNPGATLLSALAIALEAGVLLGLAYVATRSLWLPIGLHLAWNLFEGGVFGVPTSGVELPGLLKAHLDGPVAISGGSFGVEASAIAVIVCLIGAAGMYAWAHRRGQILAPRWRRAT